MSARTARLPRTARRSRLLAASAVALAATLSLTACNNGEGAKDAGAARPSSPTTAPSTPTTGDDKADGTSKPDQTGGAQQASSGTGGTGGSESSTGGSSTTGKGKGSSTGSGTTAPDPNTPANRARCDAANIKVTAQVTSRPLNTMILTATNKGSKLCDLFYAPVVRFEGAQADGTSKPDQTGGAQQASSGTGGTGGSESSTGGSSTTGKGKGSSTGSGTTAPDPNTPANRARCDAANIKVTAQVTSRPLNTMILTATNKGSKLCDLFYAPVVRFEGAQSVPPSMKDTQPQAVVSLKPGESGYAAVKLSSPTGTTDPGYTAKSLSLGFYDAGHRNVDGSVNVGLPAKGVYIDSSLTVSFWQSSLDDVSSL